MWSEALTYLTLTLTLIMQIWFLTNWWKKFSLNLKKILKIFWLLFYRDIFREYDPKKIRVIVKVLFSKNVIHPVFYFFKVILGLFSKSVIFLRLPGPPYGTLSQNFPSKSYCREKWLPLKFNFIFKLVFLSKHNSLDNIILQKNLVW